MHRLLAIGFAAGLAISFLVATVGTGAHSERIRYLEALSCTDIDKLDRDRTVFFLTFGNLEEHGPHLPIGSDYFEAIAIRDLLIRRLAAAHPQNTYVIFPVIPLGEGGANTIALLPDYPGTYSVRPDTLRDVAVDTGASIARQGFHHIFIIHFHGAPLHNAALDDAAEYVSQKYRVQMVNLTSIAAANDFFSLRIMAKYLGADWQRRIGWEGHAGAAETSMNLCIRPDLVGAYKQQPRFVAIGMADVFKTPERTGWRGYWGAPAEASSALGRELLEDVVERIQRLADRSLAGEDLHRLPMLPYSQPPVPEAAARNRMLEGEYTRQTADLQEWLRNKQKVQP